MPNVLKSRTARIDAIRVGSMFELVLGVGTRDLSARSRLHIVSSGHVHRQPVVGYLFGGDQLPMAFNCAASTS